MPLVLLQLISNEAPRLSRELRQAASGPTPPVFPADGPPAKMFAAGKTFPSEPTDDPGPGESGSGQSEGFLYGGTDVRMGETFARVAPCHIDGTGRMNVTRPDTGAFTS